MGWKRGDVIMKSEPYAHVLAHKYRLERCSYCMQRQATIKKCSGCSVLRYCGRDCQRQDWSVHKVECRCLQQVTPNTPTDSVLLLLRLVIKYVQGNHIKTVDTDPGLRTFEELMSHSEEIKKDAVRCDIFSQMCFTLSKLSGTHLPLPDTSKLLDIFGKMVINTFTIADQELQDIGSGIYLSPACLDHRCTANAVVTFRGKTLFVRAVEDIPGADLSTVQESVFLTYVDQLAPSWERQEQLRQQYYFVCQCDRCQDSSLDKAMTAGNSADQSDPDCQEKADDDVAVAAAIKTCQTVTDKVDRLKKTSDSSDEVLALCRDCLSKVRPRLSPSNVHLLRVLDRGFDAAIGCSLWEEALDYGLQTLQPYRHLLPPFSPSRGLQLLRVGKLLLWLDRLPEAFAHLAQVEQIIAVTYGTDSELFTQLRELQAQVTHGQ
ncbi:histone-lysine N-methyltransferase SMYD3-like [Babylonia areolata]|uniref:histone-lysine N-methyltransferase SMYD3-like n=1 Tax=Babylonia areolata TaxID=304850 RepID=UPI003FD2D320